MFRLDKTDKKIIELLQINGRVTNRELATKIGLSAAPCWHRVKRLEHTGIIDRYVALVSPSALGRYVKVVVGVTLLARSSGTRVEFEGAVAEMPEILECYWIGSDVDYQMIVSVTDMQGYESFLQKKLLTIPGVASVQSQIALKEIKSSTALPLDGLERDQAETPEVSPEIKTA